MGDIDWDKLYHATSEDCKPTPGYLFDEVVRNVTFADMSQIPAVAGYLSGCVDGDHAHVKLKALFVIKALAFRVPPFSQSMQERLCSIQAATLFTGPPSALFGDEPYRLVREAAEKAFAVLTTKDSYEEQYSHMSDRIIGFGNFQPDEDTLCADGSVNVTRVTARDVAATTVEMLSSGVGVVFGGMKDLFVGRFDEKINLDEDDEVDGEEHFTEEVQDLTDEVLHAGTYVPPTVPDAQHEHVESSRETDFDDLWDDGPLERTSFLNILGMPCEDPCEDDSEAAILAALGISQPDDGAPRQLDSSFACTP